MSIKDEQKKIFAKNLKYYLNLKGKSQIDVAKAIDVSHQTFNAWYRGVALPRMDKIQALADYFHIGKTDLIDEHTAGVPSNALRDEFYKQYNKLDDTDKMTVDALIERLLKDEKYKQDTQLLTG